MKKIVVIWLVISALSSFALAKSTKGLSQASRRRSSPLSIQQVPAQQSTVNQPPSPNVASDSGVERIPKNSQDQLNGSVDPAFIVVMDTSKSILQAFQKMRRVAKQLINTLPAQSSIGVVGIDIEARKEIFSDRIAASQFIDSLVPNGQYTDFNRGVDAALNLIQRADARRAAIVVLTDGQQDVPREFKDRVDFVHILKREFDLRPNIRVFVLNVNRKQGIESKELPENVTIMPLVNWDEAIKLSETILASQIQTHLEQPNVVPGSPENPPPPAAAEGRVTLLKMVVALVITATLLAALVAWARKRRRLFDATRKDDTIENASNHQPQKTRNETVVVLEIEKEDQSIVAATPARIILNSGESMTIGGAEYMVTHSLDGLKQAETLRFNFDGKNLMCSRLQPDSLDYYDAVVIGDKDAPDNCVISHDDRIKVGNYRILIFFTDEEYVCLLNNNIDEIYGAAPDEKAVGAQPRVVQFDGERR